MARASGSLRLSWLGVVPLLVIAALVLLLWATLPRDVTLEQFSAWLAPHRHAWYALPAVVLAFVALGLALVPVLLLIAATGIAFGPWLGPLYAMAGCLASASIGFAIGRLTGLRRLEHLAGARVTRITRALERNGTLAVFFLRKVPAPFLLANVVAGAARIRYRDFIVGTLLGMGAFVVALAGFGHQLPALIENPTPKTLLGAALFLGVPLTIAWFVNRSFRRARRSE
jgi:phospholipase D1/2